MVIWSEPVLEIATLDVNGLIRMIVQRARRVRRNRHECRQLAHKVEAIGKLLPAVEREHPQIAGALENLEGTLRDAVALVASCEGSSYLRRFFRSDKIAERFQSIKERIDFYLQLFPIVSHIDTTQRLLRIITDSPGQSQISAWGSSRCNRSARAPSRLGGEDCSSEVRQAKTEPFSVRSRGEATGTFAVQREEPTAGWIHRILRAPSRKDDTDGHLMKPNTALDTGFSVFEFSFLKEVTKNFLNENKIGEGGFGRVYKGRLHGQEVAVKRCFVESKERLSDFENEIKFIPKLQHRNIVKLLGYCTDGKERILVYEYMERRSLDRIIFDTSTRGRPSTTICDWEMFFRIIGGIAQGVVYLHLHSGLDIIHRDLKPSNILLDSEMNPKISDFGTARPCPPDKSRKAYVVAGTNGYMAPEYSTKGIYSCKSDVYSFGSLLLEILSGERTISRFSIKDKSLSLQEYAWNLVFEEKTPEKLIRKSLFNRNNENQIVGCLNVALLCVQEDPADRPSMWDVVLMLNSDVAAASRPVPKPPAPPPQCGGREGRRRTTIRDFLAIENGHTKIFMHER